MIIVGNDVMRKRVTIYEGVQIVHDISQGNNESGT